MHIIDNPSKNRRLALLSALAALLLLLPCPARAADPPPGAALTNSPDSEAPTSLALLRDSRELDRMMAGLDDTKKLGAGDKISYKVLEDLDMTQDLTVGDSGELNVPYFRLVQAGKKTCKQLALEIKALLEKGDYRRATVIIGLEETNKKRILGKVYVFGNVHLPGSLEIPDDEVLTVSKAIVKAGGFSDFADKRHVKLIRGGGQGQDPKNDKGIIVNVQDIWERGRAGNDVRVEADDMIYVPKKNVNF